MPTTRSQTQEGRPREDQPQGENARVFEYPPASPSEEQLAAAAAAAANDARVTAMIKARDNRAPVPPNSKAPSVRSRRSQASIAVEEARDEYEATQKLLALTRRELELETALMERGRALRAAKRAEAEERDSIPEDVPIDTEAHNERLDEWLREATRVARPLRGENEPLTSSYVARTMHTPRNVKEKETASVRGEQQMHAARVRYEQDAEKEIETGRPRAHTPPRSRDRGIEKLAEVLSQMARPGPRRPAAELPSFNGAPNEWLPFKAAMRDALEIYDFTPMEHVARLRNCLKGEAREAVSALLYTARSPDTIMQTLDQIYGRPEIVVEKALSELRRLPKLGQAATATEINSFAIRVQNLVCVLTTMEKRNYLFNPMLMGDVIEKLSPHLRARWCDYAEAYSYQDQIEPKIVLLSRFLMQEANRALKYAYVVSPAPATVAPRRELRQTPPRREERRREVVFNTTNDDNIACACCKKAHRLDKCPIFLKKELKDRWDIARSNNICFRCLVSKHRRYKCKAGVCGVKGCDHPHHRLLHLPEPQKETSDPPPGGQPPETNETVSNTTVNGSRTVLLKICPVTVSGPGGEVDTFALLDEGSTVSLIDEKLAEQIGADGPAQTLRINCINDSQTARPSKRVKLAVRGCSSNKFTIEARTIKDLTLHRQTVPAAALDADHLRGMRTKDVCYDDACPRLLLGADQWHLIATRHLKAGKRSEPVAAKTNLGWVIYGSLPRVFMGHEGSPVLHLTVDQGANVCWNDDKLMGLIQAHYDIDALGVSTVVKTRPEDRRAELMFERTAKRMGGRFEVGLPWKDDDVCMPPSYDNAVVRLRSIERKMDRDPAFAAEYEAQITNLLDKGYAVKCDGTEEKSDKQWYLPHFAVRNPNKPGKIRLVFDAAAVANGTSLNDKLLEGPDLLQSLQGIMFRFREQPVAVTADIREMFLQVRVRAEDQPAQMFLWRGRDRVKPPQRYKMRSMIFGATSSPFLAHSVRNKNARDYANEYPHALRAITESHYMDDFVDSFASEQEALNVASEVTYVHAQAGFELRSWNTNSARVLDTIPEELRAQTPTKLVTKVNEYEKTLGLLWDANRDELGFNTSLARVPSDVRSLSRTPTKREALSAVMSVYDPLGLLSPFTVTAKIQLQNLWRLKLGWDEPLPEEEASEFLLWLDGLHNIASLRLPRYYSGKFNVCRKQLHVFCDASQEAMAVAAYWRLEQNDNVRVVLAAGKAKVAPIKAQSIPRLELQAALLGARLAATIKREHRWEPESTTFWSDSRTVLQWIKNDARRYSPFVAHRLGEIAETTNVSEWRWVPTAANVADDATRASMLPLKPTDRWFNGPSFLRESPDLWPQLECDVSVDELEVAVNYVNTPPHWETMPNINNFSRYESLIRATAIVLMMAEKWLRLAQKLELRHVLKAEQLWIERAQEESFPDELAKLRKGSPIPKSSRLFKLDPILDGRIMRLRGRIAAADVPDKVKRPIILDGRHPLTRLMILRDHEAAGHGNTERVINDIRQRYWVLRLRPTARAVAQKCPRCLVRKAAPKIPVMGDLPPARLDAYSRPFSNCGVDYFGPMIVTVGRRHEKRWGALFTCLTTRAVHLELVSSLSTDSAIMAIRRMAARRGWPHTMYSDNGTNFRGADVELRVAYKEWTPALQDYCLTRRIKWHFIPPGAPNQGGAWERLVRSIKNALQVTLEQKNPKEEVLVTLLTEAEHSVNARPLTHVSVDPDDPEAITPNHFLLGSSSGLPTTGPCQQADRRQWRASQALADEFWRRWVREYLPTLVPRGESEQRQDPVKEGDLVVIVDQNLPRNVWPRGVVEKVYPGPDGGVRSADVRTNGGTFRRPVRKLAVLHVVSPTSLRWGENVTDSSK